MFREENNLSYPNEFLTRKKNWSVRKERIPWKTREFYLSLFFSFFFFFVRSNCPEMHAMKIRVGGFRRGGVYKNGGIKAAHRCARRKTNANEILTTPVTRHGPAGPGIALIFFSFPLFFFLTRSRNYHHHHIIGTRDADSRTGRVTWIGVQTYHEGIKCLVGRKYRKRFLIPYTYYTFLCYFTVRRFLTLCTVQVQFSTVVVNKITLFHKHIASGICRYNIEHILGFLRENCISGKTTILKTSISTM